MIMLKRFACLAVFLSCSHHARSGPYEPPPLKIADGFTVQLVAAPPLVKHPMLACLDERGRLFIAESDGRNLKKDGLLKERPRFVRLLEDHDGDGVFDKSTIFADGMVMPEGALWHDGALYIVSSPYLWRLEDLDGDGVADRREKILGYFEFDGRANQHGPYLGPNGLLYMTGGHFGVDLRGRDGTRVGGGKRTAGVFSCTLTGDNVQVLGLGPINPVEVVFSPEGEMFTTAAIFDSFGGRHDALVHWVRGGLTRRVYGPAYLPDTRVRLPALARWGQVAPAGLMRYRGTAFGTAYRDNFFAAQFNTHKVVRVELERQGATFKSRSEDFLVSPHVDFHPTEILEDADGSLLLIDTGGWLSWGCPTSKIAKPHVLGAIYRIRKIGAPGMDDPRGARVDWGSATPEALVQLLNDSRPAVRDRAVERLVKLGTEALPALGRILREAKSARARRNATWSLSRIATTAARTLHRVGLQDRDETVRQAAVRGVGVLGDGKAVKSLARMVVHDTPPIRRAAATALGQIGDGAAVPAIFDSLRAGLADDYLLHAQIYALIEMGDVVRTRKGLTDPDQRVRRAALIALDQMGKGALTRDLIAPILADPSPPLRTLAVELLGKYGGGAELRELLNRWLESGSAGDDLARAARGAMTFLVGDPAMQTALARALNAGMGAEPVRAAILGALTRADLETVPEVFLEPIRRILLSGAVELRQAAITLLETRGASGCEEALLELSRERGVPSPLRVSALALAVSSGGRLEQQDFELLTQHLDVQTLAVDRVRAARGLGAATLSRAQLVAVARFIAVTGPLEVTELLRVFERQDFEAIVKRTPGLASELAKALEKSPGLTAAGPARVKALSERLRPIDPTQAAAILERLARTDTERAARLAELAGQLKSGSAEQGKAIFRSNKTACSACHSVAGQGDKIVGGIVGPDLSRIGEVRQRRDLLEAVVYPSSTIVNSFETYQIVTANGDVHSGVLRESTSEMIELATGAERTVRIRRERIKKMLPSPTSLMPSGLEQGMSIEDLSDLLAYLESLRGEDSSSR